MANGDAAAAAGMDVVAATADRRVGYDEINKSRDYLANHQTLGGHPADKVITSGQLPVSKGGTGAATAAQARTNLDAAARVHTHRITDVLTADGSQQYAAALQTVLDAMNAQIAAKVSAGGDVTFGNIYTPAGRNTPVTTSWVSAAINGDGRIAIQPSALRFKDNIETLELTDEQLDAFEALRDVTYTLKGDTSGTQLMGVIAEEVLAAGFDKLVPMNTDPEAEDYGLPISVRYELMVIPLHQLIKRQSAQIAALSARLDALEANNV